MSRRITVTECPSCGAPVSAQEVSGDEVPSCSFCHAVLPFSEDQPHQVVVFRPDPVVTTSSATRAIRWVVWSSILGAVLTPVIVVVAILAAHHSSPSANDQGTIPVVTTSPGTVPAIGATGPTGGTGPTGNTGTTTTSTVPPNSVDTPGQPVAVGYDLKIPGQHATVNFTIDSAQVTFTATCTRGGKPVKFVVKMKNATVVVPANSNAWYPTADPASNASFQGSGVWPDPCGNHGTFLVTDDAFEAAVNNNTGPGIDGKTLDARWHWTGDGSDGSWSDPATAKL